MASLQMAYMAELKKRLIEEVTALYNYFIENQALSTAKAKCPKSQIPRESRIPGTKTRLWPQRLQDTLHIRYNAEGLAYLASDDPRAEWFEVKGIKPHPIIAKHISSPWLRWVTDEGQMAQALQVMHPGIPPMPFMAPAIHEARQQFRIALKSVVRRIQMDTMRKYGMI